MAKFDERNNAEYALGISATLSGTTASAGNIVDLQGFEAATLVLNTGTVTDAGTASGFAFEVQESDDTADANFTAVVDADLLGAESDLTVTSDDADNELIGSIGYVGNKRYIRVVATGTTGTDADVHGTWTKRRGAVQGTATNAADIAAT
jgi:hypothetical protein